MQLDSDQRAAVEAPGHTLVVAGPGSGKTRMLAEKCLAILRREAAVPIVAVTFTRDAADELQRRIRAGAGRLARSVRVDTFHRHAIVQLRASNAMGRLLSPHEQTAILRRAWLSVPAPIEWEEALEAIEHYKSRLEPTVRDAPDGWVFRSYQELLAQHNAMDFADLLLRAVAGMRAGRVSALPCRYLLIDEYQDTCPVQYEWAMRHAAAGATLVVVGDDDQSIYSFRHALGVRGMAAFERELAARRITMGRNYRCAAPILAAADRLIRHNRERLPKDLTATSREPGVVSYQAYASRNDEAAAVVATVSGEPHTWAVFARTLRQLDLVDQALLLARVPHYLVGGRRLWDRPHVGNLIAVLHAIATGEPMGYEQMLAQAGVAEEAIARMRPLSPASLRRAAEHVPAAQREIIDSLAGLVAEWLKQLAHPVPRVGLVIHGVASWLETWARNDRDKADLELAADTLCRMSGTLADRLRFIQYASRRQPRRAGVALMSLHASKGLEFERVFIIGCEEGLLPHRDAETIEEERRLAYVGMTRAKTRLILSTGAPDGTPSRFLVEAGLLQALPQALTPAGDRLNMAV